LSGRKSVEQFFRAEVSDPCPQQPPFRRAREQFPHGLPGLVVAGMVVERPVPVCPVPHSVGWERAGAGHVDGVGVLVGRGEQERRRGDVERHRQGGEFVDVDAPLLVLDAGDDGCGEPDALHEAGEFPDREVAGRPEPEDVRCDGLSGRTEVKLRVCLCGHVVTVMPLLWVRRCDHASFVSIIATSVSETTTE
jgi:hypothetical protein